MKIIVVDDNQTFRDIAYDIVLALHKNPLDIVRFGNGLEAWKDFQKKPAHIIVTDVSMPKMSGLDLLQRVKERSPHTEVIVMSFQPYYEKNALRLGARAFFEKPIDEKAFSSVLEELLAVQEV